MILYQPRKIWYVDSDHYKNFKEVLLVHFYNTDDFIMVEIEDNEPTTFFLTGNKFNKYFRKILLEKFGE